MCLRGVWVKTASMRTRWIATAVNTCCRWVLTISDSALLLIAASIALDAEFGEQLWLMGNHRVSCHRMESRGQGRLLDPCLHPVPMRGQVLR